MTPFTARFLLSAGLLCAVLSGVCLTPPAFGAAAPPKPGTGSPARPEKTPQPLIMRYSGPGDDGKGNYALKVLRRGPEFTETELLRFCDNVYPMAGKNPELMRRWMVAEKGWESDRVYYMMAKILLAGGSLALESAGGPLPVADPDTPAASPGEIALVRKHRARIPAAFGGGRKMDDPNDPAYRADADAAVIDPFSDESAMRAVLAAGPEFSEPELLRALADIAGGERRSVNELVEIMRQKGWGRNRAFYMLFRIRVSYVTITDNNARKAFKIDLPAGLPTPTEEAVMKKHLPELKAAQYIP